MPRSAAERAMGMAANHGSRQGISRTHRLDRRTCILLPSAHTKQLKDTSCARHVGPYEAMRAEAQALSLSPYCLGWTWNNKWS